MAYSIFALIIAFLIPLFFIRKIYSVIQTRRFLVAHSCKPAERIEQSERIIGYGLYKVQKEAIKNKNYMATLVKWFQDNGTT